MSSNVIGPWHIDINPWISRVSTTGTTPTRTTNTSQLGGGNLTNGVGALNDAVAWDVALTAGTWTLTVIHAPGTGRGIYTVKFDATTLGTIDGYQSFGSDNTASQITGISVASDAVARLSISLLTKNASSSGYSYALQHLTLSRTA